MTWNFKQELARKAIHFTSLAIIFAYFIFAEAFNPKIALLILVFFLIIALEFEYLRIEIGEKIPLLNKAWKYLRREKERYTMGGDVFFLLGGILVLAVFNIRIAVAAILMTTFGDMAAALIGTRYGKHYLKTFKERAWEGILAEFFVNLVVGTGVLFYDAIYNFQVLYDWRLWIVVFVMSITATFVETVVHKMDDNLLIPVFAGFNGQLALLILFSL